MNSAVDDILDRASRRLLCGRMLRNLSLASAAVFGTLATALFFGTGLMRPTIVIAVAASLILVSVALAYRDRPSRARLAQLLDTRAGLHDALSTELYFRSTNACHPNIQAVQRSQAENAALKLRLNEAISRPPLAVRSMLGALLLVSALFIWRFGVERSLPLTAPVIALRLDSLGLENRQNEASTRRREPKTYKTNPEPSELARKMPPQATPVDTAAQSAGSQNQQNEPNSSNGIQQSSQPAAENQQNEANSGGQQSNSEQNEPKQSPGQNGTQPTKAESGAKAGSNSAPTAGLVDQIREAVSSLMAKMRPQPGQNSESKQPGQTAQQNKANSGKSSDPSQSPADPASAEKASASSDKTNPAQSQGDEKASSDKPGSGMGHQDGSKAVHQAEQLAAMGKLTEIIGKRSASITGEMSIEPKSDQQQLQTAWSHSATHHSYSGGEMHRDEIPMEIQTYIQRYFEEVRKQPASKPTARNTTDAPPARRPAP